MKFVARKHFANVLPLGPLVIDEKSPGFQHAGHVHKGYRFNIGTTEIFADMTGPQKQLVGSLLESKCAVIDDTGEGKPNQNKATIAKIDAEVKAEAVAASKVVAPLSQAEQIALGVASALKQLGIAPKTA